MSFFISDALAETATAPGSSLMSFLPLIVIFVIFYFLLIRPQMKRAKEHKNLLTGLAADDEIITSGGVLGRITDVKDDFVTLEIADGVRVKLQKHSVATVLPKGTIKSS
jgi:preprotein translocase subunit YajC